MACVKASFFKVVGEVVECGQANPYPSGNLGPGRLLPATRGAGGAVTAAVAKATLQFDELAEVGYTLGRFCGFAIVTGWQHREDGTRRRITFRMDEGVIKRFNAIIDFEEACRLHKGGRAKPGHLVQLLA